MKEKYNRNVWKKMGELILILIPPTAILCLLIAVPARKPPSLSVPIEHTMRTLVSDW